MARKITWDSHAAMAVRGAVGGLVAGLIFVALQMWFFADAGNPASTVIHVIATIVQPDDYFAEGKTSAVIGWAVHIALSIGYGALMGLLATEFRSNVTRASIAMFYGLVIYVFNFLVLAPFFYPLFTTANQPYEAAVHLVFGAALAPFVLIWTSHKKPGPPMAPIVATAASNGGLAERDLRTFDKDLLR